PTATYPAFLVGLRTQRMTPSRAQQVARDNLGRMQGVPADLAGIAPITQIPAIPLSILGGRVAPFFGASPAQDQQVRELFWLVPVALAQALQDAGEFAAALDWYQYAYAYRLPAAQRRIFPGL